VYTFSIFSGAMYSPCASLKMFFFLQDTRKQPPGLRVWGLGQGLGRQLEGVRLPAGHTQATASKQPCSKQLTGTPNA
jgi:hypothetical protein